MRQTLLAPSTILGRNTEAVFIYQYFQLEGSLTYSPFPPYTDSPVLAPGGAHLPYLHHHPRCSSRPLSQSVSFTSEGAAQRSRSLGLYTIASKFQSPSLITRKRCTISYLLETAARVGSVLHKRCLCTRSSRIELKCTRMEAVPNT